MAHEPLEIVLKKDWDYFPHYSKPQGHFVGRNDEKNKVRNWFIRREQGCFLVSGERGAGKTALVYEAIREATNRNKSIIPVLITATQLLGDLKIKPNDDFNALKEAILVNLIRRLYAELKEVISKGDDRLTDLETLYQQAICSQMEIRNEFRLKKRAEQIEETETGENIETEIDPNQLKYLVSTILAVVGANFFYLPAFWGYQAINITLGAVLLTCPLAVTIYIKKKRKEIKQAQQALTIDELYISDRNLSNLTHDLQAVLDKFGKSHRIVVIVDEMDKVEDVNSEEQIIKAFKNLFTLSKGLFVFISSDRTFQRVEHSKTDKGISYTLYNDRIFISRPSFSDLERYLDEIIENFKEKKLANNEQYHTFRNLLCFDSKSDFFELQYKIRDYISGYDKEDRPILEIPVIEKNNLLHANLQKIVGQIFELNRFNNPSQWHMNNALLDALYKFVTNLDAKKEVLKADKNKHLDIPQRRTIEACANLVAYLLRLQYITGGTKSDEVEANVKTIAFNFSWTGTITSVPSSPEILMDYERDFLDTLERYIVVVNEIAELDCLLKNQKLDVAVKGAVMTKLLIKPYCSLDTSGILSVKLPYKDRLQTIPPVHIPREELQGQTNELKNYIKTILNEAATITMQLIKANIQFKHFSNPPKRMEHDGNVFAGTMNVIRKGVVNKLTHDCIYKPDYADQILIIQDMPVQFYEENKALINSNANHHLIINLNTTGTNYNLEFKENRNKKIKGFVDISVYKSFTHLKEVFDHVRRLDKPEPILPTESAPAPVLNEQPG